MVPSDARRMAWPICPGIESRSIIAEVAAAGAATAGEADTATGVCGIGDAIASCCRDVMSRILSRFKMLWTLDLRSFNF